MVTDRVLFRVRPKIDDAEMDRLHAEGFVNVAWDGGVHAPPPPAS